MNWIYGVCLGVLLAVAGCEKPQPKDENIKFQTPAKAPAPVEAMIVAKSIATRSISVSGTASGRREAIIISETQGKITRVNFNLGQFVKKGATLAKVDNTVQKAAWESAKKGVASASLHLKVTQNLFDAKNASEAELRAAQNGAAAARAQLDLAYKAFADCNIKAPISGYVADKELTIQTGSFMAPGAKIARIIDIAGLKSIVSVGEMEVVLLKKGMRAKIQVPAIGKSFEGAVSAVAAGSNPATGAYAFEVKWRNTPDKQIKSGMSVRINITTASPDSIIQVPATAVVERERKDAVYISIENKAAIRFVELGRVIGNNIEITSGLSPGDVLITSGLKDMKRGDAVKTGINPASGAEI